MSATFASSVYSSGTDYISQEFGISTEVVTLGTSLFLLGPSSFTARRDGGLMQEGSGFVFGPIWAPISEQYGRKVRLRCTDTEHRLTSEGKVSVLPPLFVFMCFSAGTAVAKDVQTIMITRPSLPSSSRPRARIDETG